MAEDAPTIAASGKKKDKSDRHGSDRHKSDKHDGISSQSGRDRTRSSSEAKTDHPKKKSDKQDKHVTIKKPAEQDALPQSGTEPGASERALLPMAKDQKPEEPKKPVPAKEAAKCQARGDKAFADADWDSAETHYTKALEWDDSLVSAYAGRGGVRLRNGDLAAALHDLDEALRRDAAHLYASRDRAEARLKTGDLDGAIADYNSKLALAPCDGRALLGRGEARMKKGDKPGALADLELAVKLTYPGAKELLRQARGA